MDEEIYYGCQIMNLDWSKDSGECCNMFGFFRVFGKKNLFISSVNRLSRKNPDNKVIR